MNKPLIAMAPLLLLLTGINVKSWSVKGENRELTHVTFYFHSHRLMLASENQSIYVFDRADPEPPLGNQTRTVECASEIQQEVQGVTVWVGGVCWGSRTLGNDTRMVGSVRFNVWLSSEDWLWFWELSGVGVGVAEVDGKGRALWGPIYHYQYSIGNMLSSQPSEYALTVDVDHVFNAGNHILFGVVIGSTRQSWRARVHFGSISHASRAIAPLEGLLHPSMNLSRSLHSGKGNAIASENGGAP
jgi:hypothetical protein